LTFALRIRELRKKKRAGLAHQWYGNLYFRLRRSDGGVEEIHILLRARDSKAHQKFVNVFPNVARPTKPESPCDFVQL
jgi:hypothetical protein